MGRNDQRKPSSRFRRQDSDSPEDRPRIVKELAIVTIVALVVNAISFKASHLWVCPDSSYYVALAGGLADRFDLANELFLIRPPGYPLLLAGIFVLFGISSPVAILVIQHALVVGITILTALITWHLTNRRIVTVVAGLFCACSLQLLAYANVIITEVPYTFAIVLAAYLLVKYHRSGNARLIALASLTAGVAYLIRPTGLSIVAMCIAVAMYRVWKGTRVSEKRQMPFRLWKTRSGSAQAASVRPRDVDGAPRGKLRALFTHLTLAVVPAALMVAPMAIYNNVKHGANLSSSCANLALYHRLLYMDGLDSTDSPALAEIRTVVQEAVRRGAIPAHADYQHWGPVWHAFEDVRGEPLAHSIARMGEANRDLMREHRGTVAKNTIRYAYWMLMTPDSFYRFHPGGAPGVLLPTGEYVRDAKADIFDVSTYGILMRPWIDPAAEYLRFEYAPTATTPFWRDIAEWFYLKVQKGPPLLGFGDSLYEEMSWFCLIGIIASLAMRNRTAWLLVTGVVVLQIVPSAFLAGPTPRYAVPIYPLLLVYGAFFAVAVVRAPFFLIQYLRLSRRRRYRFGSA